MPYKVGIYCRVANPIEEALTRQIKAVTQFANKQGYDNIIIYANMGNSHKELQKLMDDVRDGKINVVLVKDVSRLTRDAWSLQEYIGFFQKHNIVLIEMNNGIFDYSMNEQIYKALETIIKSKRHYTRQSLI